VITTVSYIVLIVLYLPAYQWLEIQEVLLDNNTTIYKLDITERGKQNDFYSWYTMATLKLDTKGIVYFFVRFVLTFLLMCWWNIAIVRTLRSQSIFRERSIPSRKISSTSSTTNTDGMTKLIIAIVNVTVVKQLLFLLLTAIIYFADISNDAEPPAMLMYLGGIYSYVLLFNSCVNFLLYCALGTRFREEFWSLISNFGQTFLSESQ